MQNHILLIASFVNIPGAVIAELDSARPSLLGSNLLTEGSNSAMGPKSLLISLQPLHELYLITNVVTCFDFGSKGSLDLFSSP